jgi:hypothetical protein
MLRLRRATCLLAMMRGGPGGTKPHRHRHTEEGRGAPSHTDTGTQSIRNHMPLLHPIDERHHTHTTPHQPARPPPAAPPWWHPKRACCRSGMHGPRRRAPWGSGCPAAVLTSRSSILLTQISLLERRTRSTSCMHPSRVCSGQSIASVLDASCFPLFFV